MDASEVVNKINSLKEVFGDVEVVINAQGYDNGFFNRIRQKSPILYRWVMNAVRYEGYRW